MATVAHSSAPRAAPRPRRSKRDRDLARANLAASQAAQPTADVELKDDAADAANRALEWLPLADATARTCPVVFSPDASYCFVASGSAVKIYSVRTTQLMSTLSLRPFSRSSSALSSSQNPSALKRATVTAVLVNPSNPRQLIVGSTDAKVRVWDYLEGRLLRTLEMGTPVVHAVANAALPDQIFVALAPAEENDDAQQQSKAERKAKRKGGYSADDDAAAKKRGEQLAGVYLVSLRPVKTDSEARAAAGAGAGAGENNASTPLQPARRVRLAFPRAVRALALSPNGRVLASLTPQAIHLCRTSEINRGFSQTVPAVEGEELTTLAFHPTENYFATGNSQGQIRVWYNVLGNAAVGQDEKEEEEEGAQAPSSALLHWHAHAVSSLAFTPNGAYLLSGGQEAVLVLWQLHTGHQEYVPRLGAPILTLTVLDNAETGEQQVAARLRDGSVVFVGSQKLKVVKTITGLKADTAARANVPPARLNTPTPLALDPATSALVLPAGHPSSLQFYSPRDDAQILEVEISPSNRVSSADLDRPLERTRVERAAFSQPEKEGGAYWMATLDSWANDGFAPVRQLKFWRKKADGTTFTLSTRIDRPHDAPITSLAFSPSTSSPLLLTTSTDGRIKVWSYTSTDASWRCRLSLLHRSSTASAPVAAAWSHDGSLFAVAHLRSVTLWSVAGQGELVHSFPATAVGRPKNVEFVDSEGTQVLVSGTSGALCWDLLTLEETFSANMDFATIAPRPGSNVVIATEDSTTTSSDPSLLYFLEPSASSSTSAAGPSQPRTRPLPFPIRQAIWLPSAAASGEVAEEQTLSLAATDPSGAVALVGAAASAGSLVAPSRLPTAASGAGATTRLFDEIFGAEDVAATAAKKKASAAKEKGKAPARDEGAPLPRLEGLLLETPAHSLPPVRVLWRELMQLPPAVVPEAEAEAEAEEAKGGAARDAAPAGGKAPLAAATGSFASLKPEALAGIFARRLQVV
ncbi:hypothetical protein JCM10213_006248 [Rhodosporidiobolus nylandii]